MTLVMRVSLWILLIVSSAFPKIGCVGSGIVVFITIDGTSKTLDKIIIGGILSFRINEPKRGNLFWFFLGGYRVSRNS